MIPTLTRVRRAVLSGLSHTRVHRLLEPHTRGVGALLTLHHVRPATTRGRFSPNRILEVTPDFLDGTIQLVKRLGYQPISLDECGRRLVERDFREPFVSFTLDDGYADNYTHAFPIFRKHDVPFTIYLCTGLLDGSERQWWRDLEEIVASNDRLEVELDGASRRFVCHDARQKHRTYETIYWALRRMSHDRQKETLADLVRRYEPPASASPPMLSREMLDVMKDSGLLTIGAHTVTHPALSKLGAPELIAEMKRSREGIAEWVGAAPRHFSYPYGDSGSAGPREFGGAQDVGFTTGVTTRKGILYPEHAEFLHALPRVSLHGDYQRTAFVELFLTGVPFLLDPTLRRIDVT